MFRTYGMLSYMHGQQCASAFIDIRQVGQLDRLWWSSRGGGDRFIGRIVATLAATTPIAVDQLYLLRRSTFMRAHGHSRQDTSKTTTMLVDLHK